MAAMEWLAGLVLIPVLMCAVMMGGMALAGAIGWRRWQGTRPEADAGARTHPGVDAEPRDAVHT
jgi:hypothetical protein